MYGGDVRLIVTCPHCQANQEVVFGFTDERGGVSGGTVQCQDCRKYFLARAVLKVAALSTKKAEV